MATANTNANTKNTTDTIATPQRRTLAGGCTSVPPLRCAVAFKALTVHSSAKRMGTMSDIAKPCFAYKRCAAALLPSVNKVMRLQPRMRAAAMACVSN